MDTIRVENYELYDGSIYTGECIKMHPNFVGIELTGKGIIAYPNGDKYDGDFYDGKHDGYGKYMFHDGDVHYGWFSDGMPKGVGYLNMNSKMNMGNFTDRSLLNGWGIKLGGDTQIGWWESGKLVKNMTSQIGWAVEIIVKISEIRNSKKSWAIHYKNGLFGLGVSQMNYEDYIEPFFGFMFFKDGNASVGFHFDFKKSGFCAYLKNDSSIEYGLYNNDVFEKNCSQEELIEGWEYELYYEQ